MAEYEMQQSGMVLRRADGAVIPPDTGNRDYAAYLAWRAAGNTADAEPSSSIVPTPITRRQLILALLAGGRITAEDALAAATSGTLPAPFAAVLASMPAADALAAKITWASMSVAERSSPLIGLMIEAGTGTAEEWDEVFRVGATL